MNLTDRGRRASAVSARKKSLETKSAILSQAAQQSPGIETMSGFLGHAQSLHSPDGGRKYLNAVERRRFIRTAWLAPPLIRTFCLVLAWSGARISEALAVTPIAIDLDAGTATFRTLKRRRTGVFREVPLPRSIIRELDHVFNLRTLQRDPILAHRRLWPWSRMTAWRYVKSVMRAAGIAGTPAMPKGLRHAFGVVAFELSVPPHIVQRWLGHASLRTTGIYGDVLGREERRLAARTWGGVTERLVGAFLLVRVRVQSLFEHRS